MNLSVSRTSKLAFPTVKITALLSYFVGFLIAPLFRQLPWQYDELVVMPTDLLPNLFKRKKSCETFTYKCISDR